MADIVLVHSTLGLRPVITAEAGLLRIAGHTVTTPDLFGGEVLDDMDAGLAARDRIGMPELVARAQQAVAPLPDALVFIGWSLGGWVAAQLAGSRPGTAGLVSISCEIEFPGDVPLPFPAQIHAANGDPWVEEDDLSAAAAHGVEVFRYGGGHLFNEPGLPDYDQASAEQLRARVLEFLGALDVLPHPARRPDRGAGWITGS